MICVGSKNNQPYINNHSNHVPIIIYLNYHGVYNGDQYKYGILINRDETTYKDPGFDCFASLIRKKPQP